MPGFKPGPLLERPGYYPNLRSCTSAVAIILHWRNRPFWTRQFAPLLGENFQRKFGPSFSIFVIVLFSFARRMVCDSRRFGEATLIRIYDQPLAALNPELLEDRGQIMAHRRLGDAESLRYLLILKPLADQGYDVSFAPGEPHAAIRRPVGLLHV